MLRYSMNGVMNIVLKSIPKRRNSHQFTRVCLPVTSRMIGNMSDRSKINGAEFIVVNKSYNNDSHGSRTNQKNKYSMIMGLTAAVLGLYSAYNNSYLESQSEPFKMHYRILGNTGLQVSVLSYGFWATFGAKNSLMGETGLEVAKACLRCARDHGVNLFDNAEAYGFGEAEIIMGEAIRQLQQEDPIKWRRSDLIITTKIFWGGQGPNERGLSKKHVDEGINASLKRLQMEYVDLLFCHRPDPYTPTETIVRAMTDVVRSGKAKAWGTSEWSAQQYTEAAWVAKQNGLEPPSFEQPQYNMLHREKFEVEYFPLFLPAYNMGTTVWSPLSSGLLTGKYNEGIPTGSRADDPNYKFVRERIEQAQRDGTIDKIKELQVYAKKFNCNVGQLAIAWTLKNRNVSTVLLGATNVPQLEDNFGAISVAKRMTYEDMETIDNILKNKPKPYVGFGNAAPFRTISETL